MPNEAAKKLKYKICPDSGFMHVTGICARSGIQDYLGSELGLTGDDALSVFNVYRPEDEVAASLSSYNGAIMTDDHPAEGIVMVGNNDLMKGNVSEAEVIKSDELYIMAKATITDPVLIEKIKNGKVELSAGYSRDLVEESGIHNGINYDYVQRNIVVNHVAVVDEGRCGASCKLNIDKKGVSMKFNLDGRSVDMDEAAIASYVTELQKRTNDAEMKVEEIKKENDGIEEEKTALQAEIEAKISELAKLQALLGEMMTKEDAEEMASDIAAVNADAEELNVELKEKELDAKRKEILLAISPATQSDSISKLSNDSLKSVYAITVDTVKAAKKSQNDGYKGEKSKHVPRSGNLSNDLNAVAQAARSERKAK